MINPHLLRVFTNPSGNHGDQASIVIDEGRHIPDSKRQTIARELNTGETVFINNIAEANISIMHPQGEIDFAGVAALAASKLLTKLRNKPIERMHSRGVDILTWQDDDIIWVRSSLTAMPLWNYRQLDSPEDVEQIKRKDTKDWLHTMVWAWIDEAKGLIRARTFAADWEVPEAEGNGSGALVLAAKLGRSIEIRHGKDSVMFARPAQSGYGDIGGRVAEVDDGTLPVITESMNKKVKTQERADK